MASFSQFYKYKKISNIRFVGNLILVTICEFYYDDITVTSFTDIKLSDVAIKFVP